MTNVAAALILYNERLYRLLRAAVRSSLSQPFYAGYGTRPVGALQPYGVEGQTSLTSKLTLYIPNQFI
jgi:hypothetical protein